ncbi:murein biosynthesis integral membrane protein MurJ [Pseudonocardia acaciae]|uniref:murein biosynthesis integral membrane protein MurJ n=1 Tax=Pseudonocardia acaciae TaxID=551276 RepID=UPI0009FF543F|nr:lipid II flippase MurJ [Pseudonocardia acaciae]
MSARASITVAGWTVVSRVTGLLRVLVVGAVLGPTYFANVFQAGYLLPNNVFTIMAGPVLAMVVVPALVRAMAAGGADRAVEVFSRIAGRLLALATACALALALASPLLAWTLVATVPEYERGRAWALCIVLVLFVAPQVLLYAIVALGVAAQQSRGRFALAAGAPTVESLGTIATVLITAWIFGGAHEVDKAPMAMMICLGIGNTASVLVHTVLQLYGAARVGLLVMPSRGWRRDQEVRDALGRITKSIPIAACPAMTIYGLNVCAATVPGGVMIVQLSYQAFFALSYVGARAVAMAALPRLSEAAVVGDAARFGAAWRQGLHYAMVASLLPLCLLAVFATPTADLLANGELRQPGLIAELAACLVVVAFAQLAGGIHDYGRQALFSRLDDRGPRLASIASLSTAVVVAALSTVLLPAEGGRLQGLVAAILIGEIAGAVTVLVRLRRAILPEALTDRAYTIGATVATFATFPVIGASYWLFSLGGLERHEELILLLGCGVVSVAAYALGLRVTSRVGPRVATPTPAGVPGCAETRDTVC